jgi:Ca-activated chloride channel family protein
VSFSEPLVLFGLLALPLLIRWYVSQQRRRGKAVLAFVTPALAASVAPRRPGWRRHVPMLAFLLAIAALILAAARPQRTVAVPVDRAAIMLATDISDSMKATDVSPSRLGAAQQAARRFLAGVPSAVEVGMLQFARHPAVLQSPTSDHALTRSAIDQLRLGGGGTAIGDAILTAVRVLAAVPAGQGGKRPPSAIVLLSDGGSNIGASAVGAARQAAAQHIPVYTVALGTARGTIPIKHGSQTVNAPVPVSPQELQQIATASGGRAYTAADSAKVSSVYAHLATQLGHKRVKREITASFAGGGLVLLLFGSVMSLSWFGRLA